MFRLQVLERDTNKKLKLIVDVWVGGTEGDSFPPIRTSYCAYSIYKLLDAAGYPSSPPGLEPPDASQYSWSKPIPRDLVRVANLSLPVPTDSEEEDTPGFLSRMFGKKNSLEDELQAGDAEARKKEALNGAKKAVDGVGENGSVASKRPSLLSRLSGSKRNILDAEKEKEKIQKSAASGSWGDEENIREIIEPGKGVPMERKGSVMTVEGSVAERRNSIKESVIRRETEKDKKLEIMKEKQQLLEDKSNDALQSKTVKPVKSKPQKVNLDFEKEFLALTVYRDPFYERMQMAKNLKAVRDVFDIVCMSS